MVTTACSLLLLWTRATESVDVFNKYVNNDLDVNLFLEFTGLHSIKPPKNMCCQKVKFYYLTFQYEFYKVCLHSNLCENLT